MFYWEKKRNKECIFEIIKIGRILINA